MAVERFKCSGNTMVAGRSKNALQRLTGRFSVYAGDVAFFTIDA